MASLSLSTASLRSSSYFSRDFQVKNGRIAARFHRGRCVAQMALPELLNGMGPEAHASMIKMYRNVLCTGVKLGVPIPVDDNAVAYWTVALPAAILYFTATPGPIAGLVDFVQGHVDATTSPVFRPYEVEVGRQMGEGSFGIVYEGFIYKGGKRPGKQALRVVLKKSKVGVAGSDEMRNAEIHMNRRLQRTASGACAEFLGTVDVPSSQARGRLTEGVWLIWKFEGYRTLNYYMKQKDFPENVAEAVLRNKTEKSSSRAPTKNQNALVVKKIMQQVLTNLRDLHRSGVVHRDLKPLNLVLCEDSGSFKFIDLGACVDIRSGFNYTPDETVIDPTYAAPEHYVMPTCTPALPPDPLCSLISPIVWHLNTPDRFDLYSAGLILMQLSVKQLRQDIGLQSFNIHIKRAGYDLDVWRKKCSISSEEFAILDADGGAGWELAKAMLQPRHDRASSIWPSVGLRSGRPSAAGALRHRFIQDTPLPRPINLPDFTSFPSLPSPPSLPSLDQLPKLVPDFTSPPSPPSLPSLDQLQGAALSSRSVVESTAGSFKNIQEAVGNIDTERVTTTFRAAASSALVLATGWMALTALKKSAHMSYDMGLWIAQTAGLSASAFFAFFFIIKPWLEERQLTRQRESKSTVVAAEQLPPVNLNLPETPMNHTVKLVQPGTERFKTGLPEAVLSMETQLVSLEASIQREQEFSAQQQESLARLQKLLISPSGVAYTSSEGADETSATNGSYVGRPFSDYIS